MLVAYIRFGGEKKKLHQNDPGKKRNLSSNLQISLTVNLDLLSMFKLYSFLQDLLWKWSKGREATGSDSVEG